MENNENHIESLAKRLEDYGKTNIELLKLKSIDKLSIAFSKLLSHLFLAVIFSFFLVFLSIGIALCLGECLGKTYYGFLIVSAFYAFVAILISLLQTNLKRKLKDSIISHFLN